MAEDLVKRFGSSFSQNSVLFREGDHGSEMFIIHQGEVKITKKAKSAEQVLGILTKGEFFGEMSLFSDQPRSATAIVNQDSIILRINKPAFDLMVNSNIIFAENMIEKLCLRLFSADRKISELLSMSKEARVVQGLSNFWKINGNKDDSQKILLVNYLDYLDYSQKNIGIDINQNKLILAKLAKMKLLHIRKGKNDIYYIAFSDKVFNYGNVNH